METGLTDEEIRNYFFSNREQFVRPAYASVIYKFTIDKAAADRWRKALASGGDFGEAANIESASATPARWEGVTAVPGSSSPRATTSSRNFRERSSR